MINIALEFEQQQRIQNDKAALETEIENNTNRHSEGRFDGVIGETPKYPEDRYYWDGYCEGLKKYWVKKLNRQVHIEL